MASKHLLFGRVLVATFADTVDTADGARVVAAALRARAELRRFLLYVAYTTPTASSSPTGLRMKHELDRQLFALCEYAALVIPNDRAGTQNLRRTPVASHLGTAGRVTTHSSLETVGSDVAPNLRDECSLAIRLAKARGLLPNERLISAEHFVEPQRQRSPSERRAFGRG